MSSKQLKTERRLSDMATLSNFDVYLAKSMVVTVQAESLDEAKDVAEMTVNDPTWIIEIAVLSDKQEG
jgi:hypothetical protein